MCSGLCVLPRERSVILLEECDQYFHPFLRGEKEKRVRIDIYIFSSFSEKRKRRKGSTLGKMYLQCSRFTEGPKMRSDASNVIEKKT